MKALKMDTEIPDAESRVVKLVSDFHVLLDAQDMHEFPITEPKLSVEFLCAAVEPSVLRVSVNTELTKAANKRLRASVAAFLDWLKPRVESFLMFESALIKETRNAGPKVGVQSPATRHQASGQGGSKGGSKPQSHPSPGAKIAASGAAGPPKSVRSVPTEGVERKC
ncbi:hypothetical protein PF008_g21651 [Phytophthora fragariae]|uniref:Uncharacterized protein n=1 Tax=Phytophthora fragariae TaxID=53985 RepID=A0A6G0QW07_9STRA|nr:hypothetical protein PF008_g21651 [Phytophthora fragariae]